MKYKKSFEIPEIKYYLTSDVPVWDVRDGEVYREIAYEVIKAANWQKGSKYIRQSDSFGKGFRQSKAIKTQRRVNNIKAKQSGRSSD